MPRPPHPPRDRVPSEAIGWFGELILALDRRDAMRATVCRRRLAGYGFVVSYRPERVKAATQ
jgi:hypothetical protein